MIVSLCSFFRSLLEGSQLNVTSLCIMFRFIVCKIHYNEQEHTKNKSDNKKLRKLLLFCFQLQVDNRENP